jgi:hypothetical protein
MVHRALVIGVLLLFHNLDILVGGALLGAEEKQVGFPGTLGIGNKDVRGERRRHDSPLHGSVVMTTLDM